MSECHAFHSSVVCSLEFLAVHAYPVRDGVYGGGAGIMDYNEEAVSQKGEA